MQILIEITKYQNKKYFIFDKQSLKVKNFRKLAKRDAIVFSNQIEGIHTKDNRVDKIIFSHETNLKNNNEQEILGYTEVF
ncbi:hypothetical protein [Candidatus Phytoplasma fraxini]|uniref:Uncharacterized protein n=1 Tax=Ash yellows phytoplasma TaxID=35780 RepID=A0ABZ2U7S3_ASHYP